MAGNPTRQPLGGKAGPCWPSSKVLVLTGPAGVGKKTVVRVIADSVGVELCEWTAPTPVLWQEHLHHNNTEYKYSSKLEEFEMFVESARKYPSLSMDARGKSKVVLIDDLPLVNSEDKRQQLTRALYQLVVGAQFPTVIVITEVAEDNSRQSRFVGDLLQTIEDAGAAKIAFNPITTSATKKFLVKVLKEERFHLPDDLVSEVAEIAQGDLRHAILTLQFLCLNRLRGTNSKRRKSSSGKRSGGDSVAAFDKGRVEEQGGRDQILSVFHALGKFLHNKREADEEPESGENVCCPLQEQYRRHPLRMKDPELVITQSHAETTTLTAFLHENVVDYVDNEAIDDIAEIFQYLGDADLLGARFNWKWKRPSLDPGWSNTSELGDAAAASVAARGVLFGNTHPAPRRWKSMRGPVLWQVERSLASKKRELHGLVEDSNGGPVVQATEYIPFMRTISPFGDAWKFKAQQASSEAEDEIEEW